MNDEVTTDGSLDKSRVAAMAQELVTGEAADWTIQQIPIKCLACSLHYTVWSENPDWVEENNGGYCPECGVWNGNKAVWQEARKGFIFQHHLGGIESPPRLLPGAAPAFGAGGVHAELD